MKKILGILGVAVIAATMFFSANNTNDILKGDLSMINLIGLQQAEAESGSNTSIFGKDDVCKGDDCEDAAWISFRDACAPNNSASSCVDGEWTIGTKLP